MEGLECKTTNCRPKLILSFRITLIWTCMCRSWNVLDFNGHRPTGSSVKCAPQSGFLDKEFFFFPPTCSWWWISWHVGCRFWVDTADKQPCIGTGGMLSWKLHTTGKLFHSGLPHKVCCAWIFSLNITCFCILLSPGIFISSLHSAFFCAEDNLTSLLRACRLWTQWSWLWKRWRRFRNGSTPSSQHTIWRKNMALRHHLQWNQPSGHVRFMLSWTWKEQLRKKCHIVDLHVCHFIYSLNNWGAAIFYWIFCFLFFVFKLTTLNYHQIQEVAWTRSQENAPFVVTAGASIYLTDL